MLCNSFGIVAFGMLRNRLGPVSTKCVRIRKTGTIWMASSTLEIDGSPYRSISHACSEIPKLLIKFEDRSAQVLGTNGIRAGSDCVNKRVRSNNAIVLYI